MASSCLFGFGRFGCFCVSCFAFLFGVGFVSVCLLCFVCGWMLLFLFLFVFVFSLFVFVFSLFVFVFSLFVFFFFVCFCFLFSFLFFGGFKGQVRWPKGPPHLALNPPYFLFLFSFVLCFCCCLVCCCSFVLFFWATSLDP